jgi:glyceraldehyde-3-phosphate dehydrogenase type I
LFCTGGRRNVVAAIGMPSRAPAGCPSARQIKTSAAAVPSIAPLAFLLQRELGIVRGMLNTVHSYNTDQRLLDYPHADPRRARAAALNMIPTTTSAVEALGRVMPGLAERLAGFAVRVPTPNVSLVDLVVEIERPGSVAGVNDLFLRAAEGELRGILAVDDRPLVSSDFLRRPESAIVDLTLTQVVGERMVRVVAWYDNEWGHASRLADLLALVGGAAAEDV